MTAKANQAKPKAPRGETKPRTLVDEVKAAVASAPWITKADTATVALAIRLAREIEADLDPRLGKLLVDVLSALGLTVAGRGTKPEEPAKEVSSLDVLRQRATQRHTHTAPGNPTPEPAK